MPPRETNGDLIELSLLAKRESTGSLELLKNIMLSAGIPLNDVIETREDTISRISTYLRSKRRAQALQKRLKDLALKGVSVGLRTLYKTQWRDKWKRDFIPFNLTGRLDIVPAWRKKNYQATGRQPIYIDTITAFGTGLHETTRFISQFIDDYRGRFESFLDIGTGTGILTIVALKSGAAVVRAIDIDKECIAVAKSNLAANGYSGDHVQAVDVLKLKTSGQYDFVAANLTTHDLVRAGRKIVTFVKPGKYLAVSGISLENYRTLRAAFKKLPLKCLKVRKGKQWAAVLFQR